nr:MAG TPA: hypothetical protein [Caudoviricetes sp.]
MKNNIPPYFHQAISVGDRDGVKLTKIRVEFVSPPGG